MVKAPANDTAAYAEPSDGYALDRLRDDIGNPAGTFAVQCHLVVESVNESLPGQGAQ